MGLISNRGPDFQDICMAGKQAWFGHTRLAIIDLSANGNQPYQYEHLTLAFNGMIYNHNILRDELLEKGYQFNSSSDTEVLIKSWHCWGKEALAKFDGFFAFAIYDHDNDSLHLCRDHLGKKPLYWRHWDGGIAFASRLDAVEAITQKEPFNQASVPWLFYLKYIPAPMTASMNIFKIKPGHHLIHNSKGTTIERWSTVYGLNPDGAKPCATSPEALKDIIITAVEKRLEADVPVSTLLSGGLDSTIITTLASRFVKLDSFTLGIRSDSNNLQFDESAIAEKTAMILGTNHHSVMLAESDALESMDSLFTRVFDEPFADPAAILNHLIFSQVSKNSKVCLTGDGADELFGGYRRHQGYLMAHSYLANNPIMRLIARTLGPRLPDRRDNSIFEKIRLIRRYMMALEHANSDGRSWLCREDITPAMFTSETHHIDEFMSVPHGSDEVIRTDPVNALLSLEMQWTIPGQMMMKSDRTAMDVGIEVRAPFLDRNVIETAFTFPGSQKLARNNSKAILRHLFRDDVPHHILEEPKRGFEMPIKAWLKGPFANYVSQVNNPEFLGEIGLRQDVVQDWINALNLENSTTASDHLWTLIGLKIWFDSR